MKKALITGASGFYGHHLLKYLLKETDWKVIALCRENFAGNINRIYELEEYQKNKTRVRYIWHNLRSPVTPIAFNQITEGEDVNYIFHVAASSHVDRSIQDPLSFVYDNVVGTAHILEFARVVHGLEKFLYFSTDEVFGSVETPGYKFKEWDRYKARSPYAATKAGGEELSIAYQNTYRVPVVITHCMNILGERQHPEKFLPKIIKHLLQNEDVTIHTDRTGKTPGKRHYIYADEVSHAVTVLIKKGKIGDKYNIEGQAELSNLELAEYVAKKMGKKLKYKLVPGHITRPGHDFDYAISGEKLKALGYRTKYDFWQTLEKTIAWYLENKHWL